MGSIYQSPCYGDPKKVPQIRRELPCCEVVLTIMLQCFLISTVNFKVASCDNEGRGPGNICRSGCNHWSRGQRLKR